MTYTEAHKKATNKYRLKNIERTRELNRKHLNKWYENNKEKQLIRVAQRYYIKQEIKKIMLILINENI